MSSPYEPEWLDGRVESALPGEGLSTWIPGGDFATSALVRVPRYPGDIDVPTERSLAIDAVRNEQQSGQLAVIADTALSEVSASVTDLGGPEENELSSEHVSVRFVEYVPVVRSSAEHRWASTVESVIGEGVTGARAPDVVGDPLLDADAVDVPALRAQPIWVTIDVPADTEPGRYDGEIQIETAGHDAISYDLSVTVRDVTLPDPPEFTFHLDLWSQPNSIAAEHDVEPWSEAHWTLLERYLAYLAEMGQSVVFTTIMDEPWQQTQTYCDSMVTWHHDADGWTFDYSRFDRYVNLALECGVGPEIAAYSILTFSEPERVTYYEDGEETVEELEAGSDRWRECWTAFFEDFESHLREEGWFEQTMIAIDERHEDALEAATALLETVVPELADRIQIAGTLDIEPFADDFSSNFQHMPLETDLVEARREAGKRTTFYTAGQPAHPNTFGFSPAVESRMLPWIAAENDLDGFLKWALNNWPSDVRENPVYNYPQGGEYLIYPGRDGPASSIRAELLKEGIEDYELAQRLRARNPDSTALSVAFDVATRDYDGREKDPTDVPRARELVLDALDPAA